MYKPTRTIIGAMAGAALLCAGLLGTAQADMYYAKGISGSTIYNLEADAVAGTISTHAFWNGGTALGGIATYGHYMCVTDNAAGGPVLRVFDMTPGASQALLGSISLPEGGVGKVTVDSSGNAYVAYQNTDSAKVAVVSIGNWQNPEATSSVTTGSQTGSWIVDIDASKAGAAALGRVIAADGQVVGGVTEMGVDSTGHINPATTISATGTAKAIAANETTGDTYSVADTSYLTLDKNNNLVTNEQSTIFSKNIGMGNISSPFDILGVAQDIELLNGSLAVVGLTGSQGGLWRISLSGSGTLLPGATHLTFDGDIAGSLHATAASPLGDMLWVTSATGGVYGYDFGNPSTGAMTARLGDTMIGLATHEYIAPVPEPSSLVSLLALGAGAFGFLRRRGR